MRRPPRHPGSLALLALLAGCGQDATTLVAPDSPSMAASKPGTVAAVPLSITIISDCSPTESPGSVPCRIRSDGIGAYRDGEQSVKAVLDQYGNFIFDTNNSRGAAIRHIVHDFGARYGTAGTSAGAPEPDITRNSHFATIQSQFTSGKVHIQQMAVGSSQCLALGSGYGLKSSTKLSARLSFHRGQEDNDASPTAYAVFHRTGDNTWTMSPGSTCPNVLAGKEAKTSDVGAVRSDDGTALHGYYQLPFVFQLTRK